MMGTFSSEIELPNQVDWCTTSNPSLVRQDPLVISNMSPEAACASMSAAAPALLSLGAMQCLLCGPRTPIMYVRSGWEFDDDEPPDPLVDASSTFNAFVLPAGGELLCFALSRQSTAAQCAMVLQCLQEHASVFELELPLHEWEGVTTAPTAESAAPDWMVSRMHRSSAALQRAILVSAQALAAGCANVGAGVSAVMPAISPLPQLREQSAERVVEGFEAARL